ncbi:hypothetical protein BGX34_005408 [Mortierella sp. NVP85]|nr:hypothetical protein BGX34_005408 [Mortierella sp. NVP85]
MDFHEEDPDLAEAIRLSLAEAQLRSSQSANAGPSSLPAERPLPVVIDLTDDMDPVKVEPSTETIELLHGPRIGTFERQGPRIGTFEPQGPRMGTFDDTINGNIIINNNNNKEDEDMKKAIALSLADTPGQKSRPGTSTRSAPVVEAPTPLVFDQLNRAEMERARQERIKRKATAGNTPPDALQSNGMAKKSRLTSPASDKGIATSSTASTPSASSTSSPSPRPAATSRPQVPSLSTPTASSAPSTAPTQSPRPATSSASSGSSSIPYPAQYLGATFRNTCIQGRSGNWDIRFEDLLNKDYLMKAMLTTYQLDEGWLRKYLPKTLPQCIVEHWTGGSRDEVDHDWSELVNTVYVQDFPFLQEAVEDPDELGEFGSTLYNFLTLMEVPQKILFVINTVDFSSAKVLLVPTVQGTYPVASKFTYGIAQLSKVLQTKVQSDDMEIEYQTSSVGRLSLKFLCEFSRASRGMPIRSRYKTNVEERLPPIKVVFPTERHVQMSRLGEDGAGTVCLQKKFWDEHSFPKRVMHDYECVGAHKGSLMHSKSAWGTIANKKDASTSQHGLVVSMRNWELGVVYIIETEEDMRAMTEIAQASGLDRASDGSVQSFFGPLPVPYKRPLRPYDVNDRAWCFF